MAALIVVAATLGIGMNPLGASVEATAITPTTPWIPMHVPLLLGFETLDQLNSVSCPTTNFCVAVGEQSANGLAGNSLPTALVEVWTGKWKASSVPLPSPSGSSELDSVSCSSATYCMAIGQGFAASNNSDEFAELWNGSTWTLVPIQAALAENLTGLSCFATHCLAVGFTLTPKVGNWQVGTFDQVWNGNSWTVDPNSIAGEFFSVSCFALDNCLAVGNANGALGSVGPVLAQDIDNGIWFNVSPSSASTLLTTVDCVTVTVVCTAVGDHSTEVWNGSTGVWTPASAPPIGSGPLLIPSALSCPTVALCVYVPDQYNAKSPVAETWNGSAWTIMNTSELAGSVVVPNRLFNGVSCPSSSLCVAAGARQMVLGRQPLAACWGAAPSCTLGPLGEVLTLLGTL